MLKPVMYFMILSASFFRGFNLSSNYIYPYLTPACLDSLAIGALLAVNGNSLKKYKEDLKFFIPAVLLGSIIITCFRNNSSWLSLQTEMLYRLFASLFFCYIVSEAATGKNKYATIVLQNKLFLFLGKISYGLYIDQAFIPFLVFGNLPFISYYILRLFFLIAVATVSYYIVELPLLRLKRQIA